MEQTGAVENSSPCTEEEPDWFVSVWGETEAPASDHLSQQVLLAIIPRHSLHTALDDTATLSTSLLQQPVSWVNHVAQSEHSHIQFGHLETVWTVRYNNQN